MSWVAIALWRLVPGFAKAFLRMMPRIAMAFSKEIRLGLQNLFENYTLTWQVFQRIPFSFFNKLQLYFEFSYDFDLQS